MYRSNSSNLIPQRSRSEQDASSVRKVNSVNGISTSTVVVTDDARRRSLSMAKALERSSLPGTQLASSLVYRDSGEHKEGRDTEHRSRNSYEGRNVDGYASRGDGYASRGEGVSSGRSSERLQSKEKLPGSGNASRGLPSKTTEEVIISVV